MRLRGLAALLSREFFGTPLPLPDLPTVKGLRGFGMSDPPNLASQLDAKFDYTNTFYHQPPKIDIVRPEETEWGRYDFIVSSEVMEHVPPPVEAAFANLHRLLKPDGVLLLTVPYGIGMPPQEHFPELHEYSLASPGGKTVLVNRRRDGSIETFENLCFHGGDGSTLEQRVFTEETLIAVLKKAGFDDVRIASEDVPEFGVQHAEAWSLPIVARKGKVRTPIQEISIAYTASLERIRNLSRELTSIRSEYERYIAFHEETHRQHDRTLAEQAEWVKRTEALAKERTDWAHSLDRDNKELQERLEHAKAEAESLHHTLQALEGRKWTRLGRKFGVLD